MAPGIVSLIGQFMTPQLVAKMAGTLGINPALAQTLANAALPAALAALAGVAATPSGATNISNAVSNQDPDMLGSLMKAIGGSGQGDMASAGQGMLGSLIGTHAMGGLAGAIGKFAGADASHAGSILGLVAPAVMGTLGQQDPESWSDGGGVAKLFASQKDAIASAMPAGLASALSGSGLLKGFDLGNLGGNLGNMGAAAAAGGMAASAAGAMRGAGAAATDAASGATNAMRTAGAAATGAARDTANAASATMASATGAASGLPSWAIPAIIALVIALATWYFLGRTPEKVAALPAAATNTVTAALPASIPVGDISKVTSDTFTSLMGTVAGITSVDTAKAALPKFAEASAAFDKIGAASAALPAAVKPGFAGAIGGLLGNLNTQLDKVMAIPGVGDVLKPAVDPLRAKLSALAK